nr:TMV resistance protein N-like [Ipomoea batatas]
MQLLVGVSQIGLRLAIPAACDSRVRRGAVSVVDKGVRASETWVRRVGGGRWAARTEALGRGQGRQNNDHDLLAIVVVNHGCIKVSQSFYLGEVEWRSLKTKEEELTLIGSCWGVGFEEYFAVVYLEGGLICALVGRLVVVDIVTSRRTRPSAARAKVEVNLLKPMVDRVWIEVEGKEGFWQRFEYDYVPFYYTSFSRIGHKMEVCRKGNAVEGVDMVELGVIGASMEVVTVIKEEPQALQGKLEEEEARLDLWHARFNRKEKRVIVQEAFGLRVRTSAMQRKSWAERIKRSV